MYNANLINLADLKSGECAYQATWCILFDGYDLWTFPDMLSPIKGGTAQTKIIRDGNRYCVDESTIIWEDVRDCRGMDLAATKQVMTGFNEFKTTPMCVRLERI